MLAMWRSTVFSVEPEPLRDRLVRPTLGDQLEHLALPRRQLRERLLVALRFSSPLTTSGSSTVPSASTVRQRVDERGDVEDAVLQQVAEPPWARPGQRRRVAHLERLRQQQQTQVGPAGPQGDGGLRALVGERRGHADVDEGDVGIVLLDGRHEQPSRRRRARTSRCPPRRAAGRVPRAKRGVVGDHDAHGTTASTVVPPPRAVADAQPSAHGLDPVGQAAADPMPVGSAPPHPSSSMARWTAVADLYEPHLDARRLRVLDRVRERLARHEPQRRLDVGR